MNPNRGVGFAAVRVRSESAGTIASNSGSANVAPTPRRNVRRGNDILVMMNMTSSTFPDARPEGRARNATRRRPELQLGRGSSHLKRRALDDPENDPREPIVVARSLARDRADGRRVIVLDPPGRSRR